MRRRTWVWLAVPIAIMAGGIGYVAANPLKADAESAGATPAALSGTETPDGDTVLHSTDTKPLMTKENQELLASQAEPAIVNEGGEFHLPVQMDAAWRAMLDENLYEMPPGVTFKSDAAEFFDLTTENGMVVQYEEGLVYSVASQLWRCEWLRLANDPAAAEAAKVSRSKIGQMLAAYTTVPGMKDAMDLPAALADVKSAAEAQGKDPLEWEYEIDCKGNEDQVNRK